MAGYLNYPEVRRVLKDYNLSTVCEEAHCPNLGHCWSKKHATFILLGKICTRGCKFCAVEVGNPAGFLDIEEPSKVAEAVACLDLKYVVLTSVTRDDLKDGGASIFKETLLRIKAQNPQVEVEVLLPDFNGELGALKDVIEGNPDISGHNIETIERLTPFIRHPRASYLLSLKVLNSMKEVNKALTTKSGFMVGLGEERGEILNTLEDLRGVGVDLVTIGQYLPPTKRHLEVNRYYHPDEFEEIREETLRLGFKEVVAGPLVRSSYRPPTLPSHVRGEE